jgi:hypothetical protein
LKLPRNHAWFLNAWETPWTGMGRGKSFFLTMAELDNESRRFDQNHGSETPHISWIFSKEVLCTARIIMLSTTSISHPRKKEQWH